MICSTLAIGIHLATYHFERDSKYQEFNPGIYATCDRWTAGAYQNSESRPSAYLAYNWSSGPFTLSAGGVVGYRKYPLAPLLVPSVRWNNIRLSLIPPLEKDSGGIHLSLEKTL